MREAIAAAVLAGGAALGDAPPAAEGRFLAGAVGEGVARREYKLYVPGTYDGTRPAPLVVFLHGCTQDPDDLARGTRMNEVAARAGFLVLYPAQPATANGLKCWNWFDPAHQRRGAGEPALVETMTRAVMREYRVDARRVHVAGISAGGAMALVVAAAYPELYASAATHSGIAVGVARSAAEALPVMRAGPAAADLAAGVRAAGGAGARPIPLLVLQGSADAVVNVANAQGVALQWARTFGLETIGVRTPAGLVAGSRPYESTLYGRPGTADPIVEVTTIEGLGHAWSGGSTAGTYADPQGPSASEMIAAFFARHPMPERAP